MPKKIETTLSTWEEVDSRLKILGEKRLQIQNLESELTLKINELKEQFAAKSKIICDEAVEIEKDIERFAEAKKDEFIEPRTKILTFGTVSFRLTESLKIKNSIVTIKMIKKLKLDDCIRVKEEVNKDVLSTVEDNILTKIGVTRKKVDKITIETNYEELQANIQ